MLYIYIIKSLLKSKSFIYIPFLKNLFVHYIKMKKKIPQDFQDWDLWEDCDLFSFLISKVKQKNKKQRSIYFREKEKERRIAAVCLDENAIAAPTQARAHKVTMDGRMDG